MNEIRPRLVHCFTTVFPELPSDQVPHATLESVAAWDSLSAMVLIAVLEEQFGVNIPLTKAADLVSFDQVEAYLTHEINGKTA